MAVRSLWAAASKCVGLCAGEKAGGSHLSASLAQRRAGCCAAGTPEVSTAWSHPAKCCWKPLSPSTS